MLNLLDKIGADALASKRLTPEGFLDCSAKISRVGIQEYYAFELGDLFADRDAFSIIKVYRPADEVFKADALASFSRKPVTVGHPWDGVNASNVKDVQVGFSGDKMERQGDFMVGDLRIQDAGAVNRVQRGEGELSAGYSCDVTREAGTFEGVAYDAVQRNIIGNHIALVDAGRCGPLCRVGDRAPQMVLDKASANDCGCKENAMTTNPAPAVQLQAKAHDGKTFQIDAVGALLWDMRDKEMAALQKQLDAAEGKIAAMTTSHDEAIKAKNTEIETLKASQMDASKLDAAVAARASLIGDATKLLGDKFDFKGKTDADIRKAAVTKKMGDAAVKEKNDAWFDSAFDVLVAQAASTPGGHQPRHMPAGDNLADAMRQAQPAPANTADAALDAYQKRQADRWKTAGRQQH